MREYSPADYADHAEECSKAALYRRELHLVVIVVFGFCLRHQRDLREIYWGFFCADSLSPLACYSPADYADYAEKECSKLHYFAEKDRLMHVASWCSLGFI